jgi:V/A-type H+-transporting ATPase subunit E
MKGTEKIIAHIRSDAQAQCDAILAAAQEKCDAIRADYAAQAAEAYAERIRAGVKSCADEGDSAARLGRMEAKKELLALKQDMISKSFDEAAKKLVSLPEEQYVALLSRLAADAAVTGEEEIVLNAADRARVGEAVVKAANERLGDKGRLRLSPSTGEFDGGLTLRRGNIEVNCTSSLLVELCRGEMSAAIAGVLFE